VKWAGFAAATAAIFFFHLFWHWGLLAALDGFLYKPPGL